MLVKNDIPMPEKVDLLTFNLEDNQAYLDEFYEGDKLKLRAEVKEAIRYTIQWRDLKAYQEILPEYSDRARGLIEKYMGYLPPHATLVSREICIRQAIEHFEKGRCTQEKFDNGVHELVKRIRNEDMERDGWYETLVFDEKELNRYSTKYAPYIQGARERIARGLGYYPDLCYSLQAEIFFRNLLARDNYNPNWELTAYDFKAITVVKYREVLLTKDKEAADHSSVFKYQLEQKKTKR